MQTWLWRRRPPCGDKLVMSLCVFVFRCHSLHGHIQQPRCEGERERGWVLKWPHVNGRCCCCCFYYVHVLVFSNCYNLSCCWITDVTFSFRLFPQLNESIVSGVDLTCTYSADFGADARVEWKFQDLSGSQTYVFYRGKLTGEHILPFPESRYNVTMLHCCIVPLNDWMMCFSKTLCTPSVLFSGKKILTSQYTNNSWLTWIFYYEIVYYFLLVCNNETSSLEWVHERKTTC